MIWSGDAVELFVGPKQPETDGQLLPSDRQILISAADNGGVWISNATPATGCQVVTKADTDGHGYTLEARIPLASIGLSPTQQGAFRLDIAIDDSTDGHGRTRQLAWSGTVRDSSDRTGWATARLIE